MKKLLLSILFIIGAVLCGHAQTYKEPDVTVSSSVVQTFNDVVYGDVNAISYIHFSAYVTRDVLGNDPVYAYKFQIIIVNHSKYQNNNCAIYMSGIRTFANNSLISGAYPNGFWSVVPAGQAVTIYWYKSNDPVLNFGITWENIQYY